MFWELKQKSSLFLAGIAEDVFVSMVHLTHSAEDFSRETTTKWEKDAEEISTTVGWRANTQCITYTVVLNHPLLNCVVIPRYIT